MEHGVTVEQVGKTTGSLSLNTELVTHGSYIKHLATPVQGCEYKHGFAYIVHTWATGWHLGYTSWNSCLSLFYPTERTCGL